MMFDFRYMKEFAVLLSNLDSNVDTCIIALIVSQQSGYSMTINDITSDLPNYSQGVIKNACTRLKHKGWIKYVYNSQLRRNYLHPDGALQEFLTKAAFAQQSNINTKVDFHAAANPIVPMTQQPALESTVNDKQNEPDIDACVQSIRGQDIFKKGSWWKPNEAVNVISALCEQYNCTSDNDIDTVLTKVNSVLTKPKAYYKPDYEYANDYQLRSFISNGVKLSIAQSITPQIQTEGMVLCIPEELGVSMDIIESERGVNPFRREQC